MVSLTKDDLNVDSLIRNLKNSNAGSIIVFLGEPRRSIEDGPIVSIEYSAYEEMALKELKKIESEALKRDGVIDVIIIHKIGNVSLKEISFFVGVTSSHRKEGFQACSFIVDEVKKKVPIWKEIKYDRDRSC
jgi:molybdopterin synthase catalytic subunit